MSKNKANAYKTARIAEAFTEGSVTGAFFMGTFLLYK